MVPKIIPVFFLLLVTLTNAYKITDLGTGLQMKRLEYSMRDIFQTSFDFFTAAQNGVYPVADFKRNYTQEWHGIKADVIFMAYNGWLEGLHLDTKGLSEHGKLRRMVLERAEKSANLKDHSGVEHQHEMIICDSCISLRAKRVHYAYEAVYYNYETSGTMTNGELSSLISFQLMISSGHNETVGKDYCLTELQPILLVPIGSSNVTQPLNQFNIKMKNIGIFNFLAEHIDSWMQEHFNANVFRDLQKRLDVSVRKILNLHNPCEKLLAA